MIRQAISCDVCGAEKKQTNHWFVACESGSELRLSGWSSRMRQRVGTKHLCGQTCLHKLVDEFIARTINGRLPALAAEPADVMTPRRDADASLVSPAAYSQDESSARRVTPSAPVVSEAAIAPSPVPAASSVIPIQPRVIGAPPAPTAIPVNLEDTPNYASRRLRAEAWERERNRELRAVDRHSEVARRRSIL